MRFDNQLMAPVALALLTACVDIIYPDASAYFAVGFLSHLVLDF